MNETTSVPDWLPSSATALQSFLKAHPDAERKMNESLDKSLEKMDANTPGIVVAALDNYFGTQITDMLLAFVQPDLGSRLPEFNEIIPAEAMNFLRKFTTLYAPKLVNLNQVSNQSRAIALESFLKAHPDAERQVREILDKRLGKIDANTWNSVFTSLDGYWGKESTDILYNVANVAPSDLENRLQDIGESAPVEVMNFLRKIISLYGPELEAAFLASSQLPNNWKTFYRDVYYDHVNKRSHIRVRLAKYNGEEPLIEGNADSILELTILMMKTIGLLPGPGSIGKEISDRFIKEANELIKFLQPQNHEVSDKEPKSQSDIQDKQSKIN